MDRNIVNEPGEGQEMESLKSLKKDREAYTGDRFHLCEVKRLGYSECTLSAKLLPLKICKECTKDLVCQNASIFDDHIPKNVASINEGYLRRCLELIYISASNTLIYNIPYKSSSKMGILSGNLRSAKIISEDTFDLAAFGFNCPMVTGPGSLLIGPTRSPIVGSIMRSKSMVNLLKSPLLQQCGAFDNNTSFRGYSNDDKKYIYHDLMTSPTNSSLSPSQKLEYEISTERIQKHTPRRTFSTSSTSSSSDQTSSAPYAVSQGMLQCTWKGGNLHFVFSVDDQKVIYIASSYSVQTSTNDDVDCKYLIYSKDSHVEHENNDKESHLVGKVKISCSFTLCSGNLEIRETKYVLFGGIGYSAAEVPNPSRHYRKYSGFPKKVVEAFRASPSKLKNMSRVNRTSVVSEDTYWKPSQDSGHNPESQCGSSLIDSNVPANYELAAVVIKDHLPGKSQEEVGGWGLKFLKKAGMTQDTNPLKPLKLSQCGARTADDCSAYMDVLIPAGIHGGPRKRNGGPSSLTERWKSGGQCDCGGWDLGCPLKILKTRSSKEEVLPLANTHGDCKSFDLYVQGSTHSSPTLRMVNIREGLYTIHFQSALSVLQSLSIAVAYCHSKSLSSQYKHVHEMT